MRYIQTYEGIFTKYKVGDYVLYKPQRTHFDWLNRLFLDKEEFVKIVEIKKETLKNKIRYFPGGTSNQVDPYRIQDTKGKIWMASKKNLIRKLTPEEIEEFEIRKDTDKYNL